MTAAAAKTGLMDFILGLTCRCAKPEMPPRLQVGSIDPCAAVKLWRTGEIRRDDGDAGACVTHCCGTRGCVYHVYGVVPGGGGVADVDAASGVDPSRTSQSVGVSSDVLFMNAQFANAM